MDAALLSVGDELLAGDVADTNARELAVRLGRLGVRVVEGALVGDREEDGVRVLARLVERAGLVIATGGLGPTEDDRGRQVLARFLERPLVEDPEAVRRMERRMRSRGRPLDPPALRQCLRPEGTRMLPNEAGTADGLFAERADATIFWLPGPPHEMRWLFEAHVAPWLERRGGGRPLPVARVRAFGLPEAEVGQRIRDWMLRDLWPRVGVTVRHGVVTVTVRGRPGDPGGEDEVERVAREIEAALGDAVFGRGDASLEEVVVARAKERMAPLAVAESVTGGLVSRLLVAVPGASEVYRAGVCAYSNEAKRVVLGVPADLLERHGAVSGPVALAMAEGAARLAGASIAVSTTGIAGPTGGGPEKPVGLVWFGIWKDGRSEARRKVFAGDRIAIQETAARFALDLLRRAFEGRLPGGSDSAT